MQTIILDQEKANALSGILKNTFNTNLKTFMPVFEKYCVKQIPKEYLPSKKGHFTVTINEWSNIDSKTNHELPISIPAFNGKLIIKAWGEVNTDLDKFTEQLQINKLEIKL